MVSGNPFSSAAAFLSLPPFLSLLHSLGVIEKVRSGEEFLTRNFNVSKIREREMAREQAILAG